MVIMIILTIVVVIIINKYLENQIWFYFYICIVYFFVNYLHIAENSGR